MRGAVALVLVAIMVISLAPLTVGGDSVRTESSNNKMVIGFLPYWEASDFSPEGWGLTDIVFFSAPVKSDGSLDLSRLKSHVDDIERIRSQCGCRMHLAVTIFDKDLADRVLAYHRVELANNIRSVALQYGFDGINIDFEFIRDTNSLTGQDNTDLVIDLVDRIKSGSNLIVGLDVAGSVEKVWRDSRLSSVLDYVFLMGYDYHYSGSKRTGSVSPLRSSGLSLEWSINKLLQYYPRDMIILGLPLYGYDWAAQNCQQSAPTLERGKARVLSYIENNILPHGTPHWDSDAVSPWVSYYDGGVCRQVWYENSTSIMVKVDYALMNGLKGFGFWALGYTNGASSEPAIKALTRSRSVEPMVESINILSSGNHIVVSASGIQAVSNLTLDIKTQDNISIISYTPGDIESLQVSVRQQGDRIVIIVGAEEPIPGYGLWGSGEIVNITLSNPVNITGATGEAYTYRVNPDLTLTQVPATIGEITIETPNNGGETSSPPGGVGGGEQGKINNTMPLEKPSNPPTLSSSMAVLIAVIAALAIAAFFALTRIFF